MLINGFYTCIDRFGNTLLYRGYDDAGNKVRHRVKYRPKLYLKSKKTLTEWQALDGTPVEVMQFDSMSEVKDFEKTYTGVQDFALYGNTRHIPAFIQSQFPDEIKYNRSLVDVMSLDIETSYGEGFPDVDNPTNQILTIATKSSKESCYRVWGLKPYDPEASTLQHLKIVYRQFTSEAAMLQSFIDHCAEPDNTPDVITGWNTRFFDIPYLIARAAALLGEDATKALSPWGKIDRSEITVMGSTQVTFEIGGIQSLDYMELFKKFAHSYGNQESYSLNHISQVVLGEKKLDYSAVASLRDLYDKNHQLFVDYNVKDVELIDKMEEKLGLITLVLTMAYLGGVNYSDTLGTTAIWDSIIFRRLAKKKIAILPAKDHYSEAYPGGYVKDPQVGIHDWVMSFDLNSLYPNLIVQYNMSPETILKMPGAQGAVASNGAVFSKAKKGIIPEIVEELYAQRVAIKSDMIQAKKKLELVAKTDHEGLRQAQVNAARLETMQWAIKILLNSLYGAMGNKYFRYFDLQIASGITLTGQAVIKHGEKSMNEYLNKFVGKEKDRVIAMDTDSLYICVKDVIDKFNPRNPVAFLDEFGSKAVEPMLEKAFAEFAKDSSAYVNRMVMKREAIADRGIWIAKKRYILNVHNNEGVQYAQPKIKIMGIEAVKSSTPQVCREAMNAMFKIIMNGCEADVQTAIQDFKTRFCSLPPDQVAFPRGVSGLRKWSNKNTTFEKGTPIHVRGSLLYNRAIKERGLEKRFALIQEGDKIKFTYLKTPNPIQQNIISFPGHLPTELELNKYVDYELQFEKTFIDPIKMILDAIGWSVEPVSDLQSFFS